jgi:hypothetical protein
LSRLSASARRHFNGRIVAMHEAIPSRVMDLGDNRLSGGPDLRFFPFAIES